MQEEGWSGTWGRRKGRSRKQGKSGERKKKWWVGEMRDG